MSNSGKVLVTGADGFIGSHLVELLISQGYSVKAFCLYNSFGKHGWLDSLPTSKKQQLEIVMGDIRDPLCVAKAVNQCETIYHLAALIAIPYSYVAPSSYVETNICGTLNILQAARDSGVSRVIHTSTSETYGSAQYVPIDELHPQNAQSPYAATKIAADQLALSYWRSFATPITILRPFNTYGPRQSARAVIPTIITQLASGSQTVHLGALSPTRDFNYVLDTCRAFLAVGTSSNTIGHIINSASNFEISIGDTARLIADVMGIDVQISTDEQRLRPANSEVNRLYGDNSLLTSLTNWEPMFGGSDGFRKGIELTVEWFGNPDNLIHYQSDIYCV